MTRCSVKTLQKENTEAQGLCQCHRHPTRPHFCHSRMLTGSEAQEQPGREGPTTILWPVWLAFLVILPLRHGGGQLFLHLKI